MRRLCVSGVVIVWLVVLIIACVLDAGVSIVVHWRQRRSVAPMRVPRESSADAQRECMLSRALVDGMITPDEYRAELERIAERTPSQT